MNANELLAYNQGYNAGLKAGIDLNTEPMLRNQQAEIEALKAAIISENEACAQILLDSYDTTEPYEYISPDWLLTLVDLIDDRVGRVRT